MAKIKNLKKHKHLTLDDRKEIEDCLAKRMNFKAILQILQKDPTTISYEINQINISNFQLQFAKTQVAWPEAVAIAGTLPQPVHTISDILQHFHSSLTHISLPMQALPSGSQQSPKVQSHIFHSPNPPENTCPHI